MKRCFKCGEVKALSEFYRHAKMADGYLNKCKSCTKSDVQSNRRDNIDYYRAYDRERGSRQTLEDNLRYINKNPKKRAAHIAVGNAIRDGRLKPQPCEECQAVKVHGHHDDYDKPLAVRWLCAAHHRAWHSLHREGANG